METSASPPHYKSMISLPLSPSP